ncbi:sialic acid synthase SpsE [Desulfobaculum xiamenense]|uniref:Sialic acid synthase SpsE n=1 Tax=Desulfobaculum xiamenense TaxID=995050 RepID=A0A846QFS7_9BACT|nr:N-acetylneuraminate synthase family protein [Desulfobaculum xiamenense]NJB67091.1 sialic acid synthase SpsE [Desulfobaculum xiamenense]
MLIGGADTADRVFIIAEIGNNHEGDVALAEEMIGLAAAAGADAVKFQTIVPERLVSGVQTARIAQLSRFALGYDDFRRLARAAQAEGVAFLSTPFDIESAMFLDELVPAFKIASGDNGFVPLLRAVARTGKPVLLSTGLADLAAVRRSIGIIRQERSCDGGIAALHCVSAYPTPPEQANLRAVTTLAGLGVTPGYSDHTLGIAAAILAVACGARIVEKHFTIDRNFSDFRDHALSADPADFARMVGRIREAEIMLGTGLKELQHCEAGNLDAFTRSVVAACDLEAGSRIGWEHIDWVRPGGGVRPGDEDVVLGRVLARAVRRGEMLLPADMEWEA